MGLKSTAAKLKLVAVVVNLSVVTIIIKWLTRGNSYFMKISIDIGAK